jgi:hypothetical protein
MKFYLQKYNQSYSVCGFFGYDTVQSASSEGDRRINPYHRENHQSYTSRPVGPLRNDLLAIAKMLLQNIWLLLTT